MNLVETMVTATQSHPQVVVISPASPHTIRPQCFASTVKDANLAFYLEFHSMPLNGANVLDPNCSSPALTLPSTDVEYFGGLLSSRLHLCWII